VYPWLVFCEINFEMTIGNGSKSAENAAVRAKSLRLAAKLDEAVRMDSAYGSVHAAAESDAKQKPVKQKRESTRKRIQKLVVESGKNYPSYLKLIYTGESDFSGSDDEAVDRQKKAQRPMDMPGLHSNFQPGLTTVDTMNSRPLQLPPPTCDIPLKGNDDDGVLMLGGGLHAASTSPCTPGEKMDSQKPSPCTPGDRLRTSRSKCRFEIHNAP
jgi:hypothetical protein